MNPEKAPDLSISTEHAIAVLKRLRDLADHAACMRSLSALTLGNQSRARRRKAVAAAELACAEARGYLTALVALNVLDHEDEIAWYEYLNGECACARRNPKKTPARRSLSGGRPRERVVSRCARVWHATTSRMSIV